MKYFTLLFLIVLIGSIWGSTAPKDKQYHSDQIVEGIASPEQALNFFDSFEAYVPATPLCTQTNKWVTWDLTSGGANDPLVSNAQAYTGSNSVVITFNNDLVRDIGAPVTSGTWKLSWQMYIPTGKAGYFNTLATFDPPGHANTNWGLEVYYNLGGAGSVNAGGTGTATFSWIADTWTPVEVIVDLDNNVAEFWYNGSMVYSWQWTLGAVGGGSPLQVQANDFYGATADDEMYLDDYTVEEILPDLLFADSFDGYTAGLQLAFQNPVFWTTWSNAPGGSEDPMVSNAYANSDSNSVVITQNNDLVKTFGSLTTGKYEIDFQVYIPNGKAGYFNTLAGFTPNPFNWGMEVYFDVGGGGRLFGGSATAVTFSYDYDTWQSVAVVVDLDNDMAEFWFEGSMINSWQWTLGASGGGSPLQLDANDFFGATADDEMYFDDYSISATAAPPVLDPPTNLTAEAGDGFVDLTWESPIPVLPTELAYDDGSAEGNLSIGSTAEGDLAVRFTPNVYPSTIMAIKVNFAVAATGMTSIDWTIWDGTSTGPGTSLATGNQTINRGMFDIVDVSGSAVQITADDFFISYFEPNGQTMNLSWDTNQPSANRSWVNAPTLGFPWQTLGSTGISGFDNNLMIRALVQEGTGPNARMVELSPNGESRVLSAAEVQQWSLESQRQTGSISTGAVCLDGTVLPNDTYVTPVNNGNLESVEGLNGFNIYRSLDGTNFSLLTNVDSMTVNYTDNAVTNGTTYWYYVTAVYDEGESASTDTVEATPMVVGIGDTPGSLPTKYALNQNYPNPFNPSTTIKYQLPRSSQVTISIYNLLGQKVRTLVNSNIEPGYYEVTWNGLNDAGVQVGSGIYFYRFQSDDFVSIKKMMFLK